MVNPNNSYVKGLADNFEAEFIKYGTIVGKETYTGIDSNFTPILSKIKTTNPDVIYLPDYYDVANLVLNQAKGMNITKPFIGSDGWDSPDLDLQAASNNYFTNHLSFEDSRQEVTDFIESFNTEYGHNPDVIAALSYDATKLMFQAMQEANTLDTTIVKGYLENIVVQGVSGSFYFDVYHNPIKNVVVNRVQINGVHFFDFVPPPPHLSINFKDGSPGSYFWIRGIGFPVNSSGTISLNGNEVGTVQIDNKGGFAFRLSTNDASEGSYIVKVISSVEPGSVELNIAGTNSAITYFTLKSTNPSRPQEGSGQVIDVPVGIALDKYIYLPIISR